MRVGWHGDFNGRVSRGFALVCLLLSWLALAEDSGGLRLNGITWIGNGNAGILHSGDPDSHHENRENDKGDSETLFAFSGGGGRSSRGQPKSLDEEFAENSENLKVADSEEGSGGGIFGRMLYILSDGSGRKKFSQVGGTNFSGAISSKPSAEIWLDANKTKTERGESGAQDMSSNVSSTITNGKFGDMSGIGGHFQHNSDRSRNLELPPVEKNQTDHGQGPIFDPHQLVMVTSSMSTMVVRSTGVEATSRSEEDIPKDSDDAIVFPDELEHLDEEESDDDDSSVDTYFFIRAPQRNRTITKCGPNQRFFRGRCRTHYP